MKTLLLALMLVCLGTDVLLALDWFWRGEWVLASAATALAVVAGLVALFWRRLRL